MRNHFRAGLVAGASLGVLLELPSVVFAQEVAAGAADDATGIVDEIIVTAQRRSENKQDVPITLTVIDGDYIEAARVQSVQDIVARTPGFGFDTYPQSEPRLSIRGVGSSSRGAGGDPSTAIFIDEIYYGRPAAITFETYDVERVEVLKGPQGTLFGRNVAGGAVSVVTTPPDINNFEAAAEASYGNYNRTDVAGFVNAPLSEGKAAMRLTGTYRRHDGYVDRVLDGEKLGDLDDLDSKYARLQFALEPNENFRVNLKGDYLRERGGGPGNRVILDLGDGGLSGMFAPTSERNQNAATFHGQQDRDTWGIRAEAEVDLSFASLRYLGSYRELEYTSYYDFDGAPPVDPELFFGIEGGNTEKTDFYSNELQLRSLPSSNVSWVVGLYQYRADTFRDGPTFLTVNDDVAIFDIVTQDGTTDSKAIYADASLPITDTVNIFGGVRYTEDKKSIFSMGDTNSPGDFYTIGDEDTPGFYATNASDSWEAFTWRGGTNWKITPDMMVYASVARGFKSGGFQDTPQNSFDTAASYDPEYATNFEIGQRGAFLNGAMIWNNSVYFTDYDDLQTRIPTGFGFRGDNASAEIYGLESELNLRFGRVKIAATYAYTHARYTEFATFEDDEPRDYSGNQLTRVPEHKFTIGPSYEFALTSGATVDVGVDYAYEGKIYDDHSNLPPEIRDPTSFIDARAVFKASSEQWSFALWGKNLGNETTATYQGVFGGVLFGAYNPPRTYGATVSFNWE